MSLNLAALQALAAQKPDSETVAAWGGELRLRKLTLGERLDFGKYAMALEKNADAVSAFFDSMLRLVLITAIDDDGARLFADGDEHVLRALPHEDFNAVRDAARRINGMMPESEDAQSPLSD